MSKPIILALGSLSSDSARTVASTMAIWLARACRCGAPPALHSTAVPVRNATLTHAPPRLRFCLKGKVDAVAAEMTAWLLFCMSQFMINEADRATLTREGPKSWKENRGALCRSSAPRLTPILETLCPTNETDNALLKKLIGVPVQLATFAQKILRKHYHHEQQRTSEEMRHAATQGRATFRAGQLPVSAHAAKRVAAEATKKHPMSVTSTPFMFLAARAPGGAAHQSNAEFVEKPWCSLERCPASAAMNRDGATLRLRQIDGVWWLSCDGELCSYCQHPCSHLLSGESPHGPRVG